MLLQQSQDLFKNVMGNYPTGVTILTTINSIGKPVGLTVNSFASVSLNPQLILWSIDHKADSLESFTKGNYFAVHMLAGDQQELCNTFARKKIDRFKECHWTISENNLPIIEDVFAVLQCKKFKCIEAGDHTILVGEVIDIEVKDKEPALYHRRQFGPIPSEFYSVTQK
ncbi:oxygenase [Pueribacillus theae]|uniref:Oxygenase n=1 Tax=Pueribacillus theae TaxID=2171751 RepID=A0A2U1K4H4_9BACI|nr:flavin reductase family protein [Pueribacillus theae]PWA12165.1 oxygenase [Pueribacillus theae]